MWSIGVRGTRLAPAGLLPRLPGLLRFPLGQACSSGAFATPGGSVREPRASVCDTLMMSLRPRVYSAASPPDSVPRRLLVVDFDDTCTVGDTISLLVSAAMMPSHHDPARIEEKQRVYETLLREYIEERNVLIDRLFGEEFQSLSADSGKKRGSSWLDAFLRHLSDFETRRNDVVLASNILHGATMETITHASRNVVFRDDCLETLHRASLSLGTSVTVLSANWSEEFIRASLGNPAHATPLDVGRVEVVANSLEFCERNMTTGDMRVRRCQTPADKDRLLESLIAACDDGSVSVYVGDSVGDIPALLGAGLGIVMGNNALLKRVLERGGVEIRDLEALMFGDGIQDTGGARVVYQTESWALVRRVLGL